MGVLDFVKDAGERVFGRSKEEEASLDDAGRAAALHKFVTGLGLPVRNLAVGMLDGTATVRGVAATQADREKIVLAVGNAAGVERVDDRMTVETPQPPAVFYTVVSGDTLSGIAKAHYGAANTYMKIFEANRPLLEHPDRIYPGQVLRIPPM